MHTIRHAEFRSRADPRHDVVDERALCALRDRGWATGEVLGTGTEGTVVALTPNEVAKVWHGRERHDLEPRLRFGEALGRSAIPFRTSRTLELLDGEGPAITIEERVHGRPLRVDSLVDPPVASANDARLMGDALAGLALGTDENLAVLPILAGEPALGGEGSFASALADLAERRFYARPTLLRARIGDIDLLVEALLAHLRRLPERRRSLIHGDLIPANVLIDGDEVAGVVDFGFMTALGDPGFDAAIAASIFDMYGANARESERVLTSAFLARFGHDHRSYGLYRAAYAVVTNSVFATDGSDGHFRWCAAMLERDDVRAAIHD